MGVLETLSLSRTRTVQSPLRPLKGCKPLAGSDTVNKRPLIKQLAPWLALWRSRSKLLWSGKISWALNSPIWGWSMHRLKLAARACSIAQAVNCLGTAWATELML